MHIHDLPTPALLLDGAVLQRNIDRMAEKARTLGVALRPHIKTHKCLEIARRQREAGAQGLTVATLAEARVFAAGGFEDITHAFPLDPGKFATALEQAGATTLRLTIDDLGVARALNGAAGGPGKPVHVWLKVDVGNHRAGVDPASARGLRLARYLHEAPHLAFDGLLTHAGQAYHAASAGELRRVARQERDLMVAFAARLQADDIDVPVVSIGSTPTLSVADELSGVQEIRPGNYVFHDRTQLALGSCALDDCALTVLATVVSRQPGSRRLVTDAGALALSHDPGPVHLDEGASKGAIVIGTEPLALHPSLRMASLSQEHGIIEGQDAGNLTGFKVGSKVRILPNHACLAAPLYDAYSVVQGEDVVDSWPIERQRQ